MQLLPVLYAALFSPGPEAVRPSPHLLARQKGTGPRPDLGQHVLYESFVPIDAVVFMIGTYSPSEKEIGYIIRDVLRAKKEILRNKDAIGAFGNFSKIVNEAGELGRLIMARNSMISTDKSFIMRNYVKRTLCGMAERLREAKNSDAEEADATKSEAAATSTVSAASAVDGTAGVVGDAGNESCSPELAEPLADPERDQAYEDMIRRLRRVIYDNGNLGKRLALEKEEFYRKYTAFTDAEVLRTKIAISLGGFALSPLSLPGLIYAVDTQNKEAKVREWVNGMMRAVEGLELKTRTKSFFEMKTVVKDFLEGCLRRRGSEGDDVIGVRSKILLMALGTQEKIDMENWRQEKYIKELIEVVDNMRHGDWIVKYNKEIADDYVTYLLTGQPRDKARLLSHFK